MSTTVIKNYSVAPYYDDFDETKNYHRVLYRPGYAVQARELTQMQTTLQAQIDRHGQYAFKHGSRVVGGKVTVNIEYDFIKIDSTFVHTVGGSLNSDTYLSDFVGTIITGTANSATQLTAKVLAVTAQDGTDPNTLFIKYTSTGGANRTTSTFAAGEEFAISTFSTAEGAGTTTRYGQVQTSGTVTGKGAVVNIEEGVYFLSGTFVYVPKGSLILDKYTNTPSYTVGLSVTESIVDSGADTSLLDNAQGVPNTAAPGATRYKISTALVKESLTAINTTYANYVTLLRISAGVPQTDNTDVADTTTELSKRLARRTYEESGNYAVRPYQLDIREHLNNGTNNGYLTSGNGGVATKLAIGIEPSVSYVQGFRNENIATKYVVIDKPRDAATSVNTDIAANVATPVGNYIKLLAATDADGNIGIKGMPDVNNFSTINLHNAVNQGGSVVGTARARAMELIGGVTRLHLFDIKMTSGAFFSAVRSLFQTHSSGINFTANLSDDTAIRYDVGQNGLVFKLPYSAVKTLYNSGPASTTEYTIKKDFAAQVTSNQVTISLPSGGGHFTNNNTACRISVGGNVMTAGVPTFVGSAADDVTTLTFSVSASDNVWCRIIADVEVSATDKVQKEKLRQNNASVTVAASGDGSYLLGKADIIRIVSVTDATSTVVTERFNLDNGQRDNFYDKGRILQKPGTSPVSGNLTIVFDYYTHGAGDHFSVDSYPAADYATIGTFDSAQGTVELRDCIDFRPRKADAADDFTSTGSSVSGSPDPSHAMNMFAAYYMPRIDKLYVTKEGEFKTVIGVPSDNPKAPEVPADAMGIYDLRLNPYIFDINDVNPKIMDNKRYTMRDIGSLDKRIKTLEYYTSLSLLEQSAANTQLFDGANFSRTKNGFVVDGFRGHNVGDSSNPDYKCAIDKVNGVLRPQFDEKNVNLVRKPSDSGTVVKSGPICHLPTVSGGVAYITQPYASFAENVNPYNVFSWDGVCQLSPDADEWKETDVRPDVIINDEGLYDQMVAMAEEQGILGTVWNEWETNWTGVEIDVTTDVSSGGGGFNNVGNEMGQGGGGFFGPRAVTTTTTTAQTTTTNQSKSGLNTSVAADTVTTVGKYKVVEVNFVPFMRSRRVFFKAQLLKPNTKMYAFFNGTDITTYVNAHATHNYAEASDQTAVKTFEGQTQWVTDAFATSSNSGSITTDATGVAQGSFIIPRNDALKFKTGQRTFKLTDSSTNNKDDQSSTAEAQFRASGLLESVEREIVSTKVAKFVTSEMSDSQTLVETDVNTAQSVEYIDPLAQSFLCDTEGGVFLDNVKLFFKTKDANIPVRISIRSVVNGTPTQKVVPGSDVIMPAASVNLSANAATSTTFNFDYPIYLAQNQEYAIVIMAQSDSYEVYVADMGGFDLTVTTNRITKQPYNGVFFTSANASTWTPEQSKDLKFTINRCQFSGSGGAINLVNDSLPARKLQLNSLYSTSGSGVVKVFHKNHGMQNALNPIAIVTGAAAFNGITAANLNGTHSISNVTHDTYTFVAEASDTASATGSGGGAAIYATENRQMDVIKTVISQLAVPGTQIRYHLTPYTETEVIVPEAEILANNNVIFSSPKSIASDANSASKTFNLRCVFTTDRDTLSPIIDMDTTSVITIQNIVDDIASGDELSAVGGNQLSRYITKKVELAEEADIVSVFINANRPRSSNIDLYYRVLEGGSSDDIATKAWTAASPTSALPINDNPRVFQEVEYSIDPLGAGVSFGTMQFKIVLRSTNSATVPQVKDFRAIAAT